MNKAKKAISFLLSFVLMISLLTAVRSYAADKTVVDVIDCAEGAMFYSYNDKGLVTIITDAWDTYNIEYNDNLEISKVSYHHLSGNFYETDEEWVIKKNSSGQIIRYKRGDSWSDKCSYKTTEDKAPAKVGRVKYKYNADGKCVKIVNPQYYDKDVYKFSYNNKGDMKYGNSGTKLKYTYDVSGKVCSRYYGENQYETFNYNKISVPSEYVSKIKEQQWAIINCNLNGAFFPVFGIGNSMTGHY